jgi:hypothetical protein
MGVPQGDLSPLLPLEHDSWGTWFSSRKLFGQLTFKKIAHFKDNFFSSILFVDEKENSKYGLNLGLLGCNEDSNHYIN